jgi:hypothetical protein
MNVLRSTEAHRQSPTIVAEGTVDESELLGLATDDVDDDDDVGDARP